jgi:hypothetical protein
MVWVFFFIYDQIIILKTIDCKLILNNMMHTCNFHGLKTIKIKSYGSNFCQTKYYFWKHAMNLNGNILLG